MSRREEAFGCLFCRSGAEDRIIEELKNSHPELNCISPKRERIRRQGEREIVPLFPGYILFKTEDNTHFHTILQKNDIYRLLKYPNGSWELSGNDLEIAVMLFEIGGLVRLSVACFEGNTVKMIDGPLKKYEDRITEINKRAKTAKLEIEFHGKRSTIWLGFEIV